MNIGRGVNIGCDMFTSLLITHFTKGCFNKKPIKKDERTFKVKVKH